MSCDDGHLALHDGANEDSLIIGIYCGEHFPWQMTSSGNQLYLSLHGLQWGEKHRIQAVYTALSECVYIYSEPGGEYVRKTNVSRDNFESYTLKDGHI